MFIQLSFAPQTNMLCSTKSSRPCPAGRPSTTPSGSVRVFVLPQGAGVVGLRFRCSLEQEAEVRRDERVRRRHRIGVVNGAVLAREGDPARVLTQTIL